MSLETQQKRSSPGNTCMSFFFQKFYEWKDNVARDAAEIYLMVMENIRSCYENRKQELYRAAQSIAPSGIVEKYEDLVEYLRTQYRSE